MDGSDIDKINNAIQKVDQVYHTLNKLLARLGFASIHEQEDEWELLTDKQVEDRREES